MSSATRRLVLCGTNYGSSYLPALDADDELALAGILARGSDRSRVLAKTRNVPLWSSVDEVAEDVELAVVALPPVAAASVTKKLCGRGIHVLLEHPVARDVLEELREHADKSGVTLNVNCHFAELGIARTFLEECARRRQMLAPRFASVITAPRMAYATFDLLGRALGELTSATLEREGASTMDEPELEFQSFRGRVGGVRLRVLMSTELGAVDDGSDMPIPQRMEIGFEDGSLMLVGPAGPVLWMEKLRLGLLASAAPVWKNLSGSPTSFGELMRERIGANRRALAELSRQSSGVPEPIHQSTSWLATVATLTETVRRTAVRKGGAHV